ncbi:MAG: hypothetical protein ACPLX7_06390 [Candidatus Kapaibacteriota bacterium]|jgi:hypothetical protein
MKRIVFLFLSLLILFIACSKEKYSASERKFMKTYKEILIVRYTLSDSIKANQEVDRILKRNGFTLRDFLDYSWKIRMKDVKKFNEMMDSIKNQAALEVLESRKSELQKR